MRHGRNALVLVVTLVLAVAAFCNTAACGRDPGPDPVPGVRLGMTPRDVRDHFEGGGQGAWQTRFDRGGAGASDDTVVEWTATDEKAPTRHARFEFHLGMLVAIRAQQRDPIAAERIDVTPKTVTRRVPGASGNPGTDVTVLSRDCPTHHEEAEALATRAR